MANGITISPDGKTVFVNDPLDMNIMALWRNVDTGELKKVFDIKLPSVADNIEYDDEAGEIIVGNIFPGGLVVATPPTPSTPSIEESNQKWIVKGVLIHDNKKNYQVSAAARVGNSKVVLGSPFQEGILVCSN